MREKKEKMQEFKEGDWVVIKEGLHAGEVCLVVCPKASSSPAAWAGTTLVLVCGHHLLYDNEYLMDYCDFEKLSEIERLLF